MFKDLHRGLMRLQWAVTFVVLIGLFWGMVFLAHAFISLSMIHPLNAPLYTLAIVTSVFVFFSFYEKPSYLDVRSRLEWSIRITIRQMVTLCFFLFGCVFITKDTGISRLFLLSYLIATGCVLLFLNRYGPQFLLSFFFSNTNRQNGILIGDVSKAEHLLNGISSSDFFELSLLGILTEKANSTDSSFKLPILGTLADFSDVVCKYKIMQVILLDTHDNRDWVSRIEQLCMEEGCHLLIYNPLSEYVQQPLTQLEMGEGRLFVLRKEPLMDAFNCTIKRILDVVIAFLVVLFFLPILCVVVWIMHRLQSPGPLFYQQKRTGLNRNVFLIYKFRTLHVSDQTSQVHQQDERVYPFGRFLRKTSLDEFPQFWNVLIGKMSLVGPRPHWIEHEQIFTEQVLYYRQRHWIKPGLTGLAQVHGLRGEMDNPEL
ncbi:MAG: sugar transferase, partial [Ignavibacteria bacterium]|nr:sugar transferase [Ignavibacteria bacterium]